MNVDISCFNSDSMLNLNSISNNLLRKIFYAVCCTSRLQSEHHHSAWRSKLNPVLFIMKSLALEQAAGWELSITMTHTHTEHVAVHTHTHTKRKHMHTQTAKIVRYERHIWTLAVTFSSFPFHFFSLSSQSLFLTYFHPSSSHVSSSPAPCFFFFIFLTCQYVWPSACQHYVLS